MSGNGKPDTMPLTPVLGRSVQGGSDFSGELAGYSNVCRLDEVLAAYDELLLMPDHGAVYVTLAGVVANYATGDAVWPLLVGPPGCGKSELVSSLIDAPLVWALSSLTPQTLISGYEHTRDGKPASLLKQIGDFGILAFKDLTTVLEMPHEARAAIIGQLREVADGKTEKSFGNGLRVEWAGKLGLVAGVTPVIDQQHAFLAVMGERFTLYRLPEVNRHEIARRALARRGHELELRQRIRATVGDFLEQFRDCGPMPLPEEMNEDLIVLADIVTRARSGVARDGYSRDMLYLPEPEAPTRLAKQLAQLHAALLLIGAGSEEAWRVTRQVGWDSVPAVRCTVLDSLRRQTEPVPYSTIEEETGLPNKTVERAAQDLVALKLATRGKDAGKWYVQQSGIARDYWLNGNERSPEKSDPPPGSPETSEGA